MKNKITFSLTITAICLLLNINGFSQGTSLNTTGAAADTSAILDISSSIKGILIPRMTKAEKLAIVSPAPALMIYQTDDSTGFWYYKGTSWVYAIGPNGAINAWDLTGNTGTTNSNFIGTIDSVALNFRVKNQKAGKIDPIGTVFLGYQAGNGNNFNSKNTGIGYQALYHDYNGSLNTANGYQALYFNTYGNNNTANGFQALYNNDFSNNTACGYKALFTSDMGNGNTALGYLADVAEVSLSNTTAIGANAQVGSSNSMVLGSIAGVNGATESVNVGIGTTTPSNTLDVSGNTVTVGNFISIADSSYFTGVTGKCRITPNYGHGVDGYGGSIGVAGYATLVGIGNRFGVLATGQNGTDENYGVYGYAAGGTTAYGVYGTASGGLTEYAGYFSGNVFSTGAYLPSDRKLKNNIKPMTDALAIIGQLKPSVYTYKTDEYKQMNLPAGLQYGLIADEVKLVVPSAVTKAVQPAVFENNDEQYGKKLSDTIEFNAINYTELIPIVVAAVKEQQSTLTDQNSTIETQNAKIAALQMQIDELKALIKK
jgi:trimeric autotransporter adhesin